VARSFSVHALKTPLIRAGDELAAILFTAATRSTARGIRDGDVIVVANRRWPPPREAPSCWTG